jgi:hypothetical protein
MLDGEELAEHDLCCATIKHYHYFLPIFYGCRRSLPETWDVKLAGNGTTCVCVCAALLQDLRGV